MHGKTTPTARRAIGTAMLAATVVLGGLQGFAGRTRAASDPSTLTIGWAIETKTLDPVNNPQNPDIWVDVNIFDQLIRTGNDGASLQPDLATSWTISKDNLIYTLPSTCARMSPFTTAAS